MRFAQNLLLLIASAATVSVVGATVTPVTAGEKGPFSAPTVDVGPHGYVVEEFYLDGIAASYALTPGGSHSPDGKWATTRGDATAPFRSRMLVVRPASNSDFNGTVVVHWQNVTAGYELGSVDDGEYLRGYAWVGVSAQKVGVDGLAGPQAAGLKQWDPARYGSLNHPGDGFSYDIFSQAGHAVGPGREKGEGDPLGGLEVKRLIAAGASQSAHRLRTYINGVHPLEKVFDGFIPYIDFGSTIPFVADFGQRQRGVASIRSDLAAPVIVVNSETESSRYFNVRQPDSDKFRFWEVAGTSHVSVARDAETPGLDSPNWLSYQPVYSSALRHMHQWLADGKMPPKMPRINVKPAAQPMVVKDDKGNAVGGIRLPELVVPTATHDGIGRPVEGGSQFAFLYGRAYDFPDEVLKQLYPTPAAYLAAYDKALKAAVDAGAVLAEDAPALRDSAAAWSVRLATLSTH